MTPLVGGLGFGEGPRWFEGLLWFSDMLGEAVHTVDLTGSLTTVPVPGHAPSGLGFRPDGTLLIVSTKRREVLCYDGDTVATVADLGGLTPAPLGDMTIDDAGRAYISTQARSGGVLLRLDPDGHAAVVADDLDFPNGLVFTPDGATLIVAESTGRRLTAFPVTSDGALGERRPFATYLAGPPDGLAIDTEGGVWAALTLAHEFVRVVEGGVDGGSEGGIVTDRIEVGDRMAIACALGGPEARVLFLVTTTDAYPERMVGTKASQIDAVTVDVAGLHGEEGHSHV